MRLTLALLAFVAAAAAAETALARGERTPPAGDTYEYPYRTYAGPRVQTDQAVESEPVRRAPRTSRTLPAQIAR